MIQIDMEMPDSCRECWFMRFSEDTGSTECDAADIILARYFKDLDFEGRHEECPLVDVPEINVGNGSEIPNSSTDCISRQAAIDAIRAMQTYKLFVGDDLILIDKAGVMTELMMMPSAQPERKKGKWVDLRCNQCGQVDMSKPNFCPNCGSDMRGR